MSPTEITIKVASLGEGGESSKDLISAGEGEAPAPTSFEGLEMDAEGGESPPPTLFEEFDMTAGEGEAPKPTSLEELEMTIDEDETSTPISLDELDMETAGMNLEELPEPDLTEELEENVEKKKITETRKKTKSKKGGKS